MWRILAVAPTRSTGRGPRAACFVLAIATLVTASACSGGDDAKGDATGAVVTIRTVEIGDAGNAAAAIVPFHPGIYDDCSNAPSRKQGCLSVGAVDYDYEIGELEITVGQYVAFLNSVDAEGTNDRDLYVANMSPSRWPKFGSIAYDHEAGAGEHYSVAYPEWEDKPIAFANFPRSASFVNALVNGDVLSRTTSTEDSVEVVTYSVRLSDDVEDGMYDLSGSGATRKEATGFVVPSNDEWIKAAYFDPNGGGTFSYWRYPTGPVTAPTASSLDQNGNVVNADTQPLSTFSPQGPKNAPAGTYPTWCPAEAGSNCETVNPLRLGSDDYTADYQANVSTVGQTRTRSPWGTLDQGGNAVEWTDTIAPSPSGSGDARVWRYAHGGVANAPAYQLWISATGRQPEENLAFARLYPWQGFRIGVVGDLEPTG